MSLKAHLFVIVATLVMVAFVVASVRQHRLKSKFSLLWIAIAAVTVVLAAFPALLNHTSYWLGVYYPPTTVLALAVAFLFAVVVHYSWELSRLEDRTRILAEEIALLRSDQERLAARVGGGESSAAPGLSVPGAPRR
jgi:hypothetical protein